MRMNKKGFTLIELMIVVAIIGILAAIAIPNFLKFQAKSKQSEAKTNLKGVYTAETAFFGENNTYSDFNTVNWVPVGGKRIYGYSITGAVTGVSPGGDTALVKAPTTALTGSQALVLTPGFGVNAFTACAAGNISTGTVQDTWSMNDVNVLVNQTNGIN